MTKKFFNWIMAALFIIVVIVAGYFGISRPGINGTASGDRWNNENNVSFIKRRGYIRIAVFGDLPPYGWVNSHGKRVGYDVRLARRVAKDLGVKAKFIQVNANNRIDTLNSNKADIVLASWTKPYMKVSVGVISPKSAPITDAKELKNRSVIVTKGTTAENYFTKQKGVNLLKFDSKTQQFNAIKNGRGAALADDNSYLYAWVKQNPKYTVGIKTIGPNQYIFGAVKKGNKSLQKWMNREITKLNQESFFTYDYNKELKPYFGKEIRPSDIVLKQGK